MKANLSRMLRSALALLLAFSMVVGYVPAAVFAKEVEEPAKKYVSLGDSMSNGYGLEGYDGNTGVEDYGDKSYANQFAEHLGAEHAQLAMSAMRAEDLHWLLEVDYDDPAVVNVINQLQDSGWNKDLWYSVFTNGDYWTWAELVNDYRFDVAAYCIEGKDETDGGVFNGSTNGYKKAYKVYSDVEALKVVAKYYQESVRDADVVSLGIGNGNFGVFMFGRITDAIGFGGTPEETMIYDLEDALRECDPAMKAELQVLLAEAEKILASKGIMADDGDDTTVSTMEALYNSFMYAVVSYVLNYAGTVEAILKLNPDAEIIQVALMNTMQTKNGSAGDITLGGLMELLFTPLNAYIAALPTAMQASGNSVYAEAAFYWAEAPYVECIVDTYELAKLDDIVRDRFVTSIVGACDCGNKECDVYSCSDYDTGMVWGLLGSLVQRITLADIEEYEGLSDPARPAYAADNADKAMSISMYLAFENAIIASKDTAPSVSSVLGLGAILGGDPFGPIMERFYAQAAVDGDKKLDVVAPVVSSMATQLMGEELLTADDVKALVSGGEAANAVYYSVAAKKSGMTADLVKAVAEEPDGMTAMGLYYQLTANQLSIPGLDAYKVAEIMDNTSHEQYETVAPVFEIVKEQTIAQVTEGVAEVKATVEEFGLVKKTNSLCTLLVMPETLGTVVADSELSGLLGLFARCMIGNGIGSHPSANGHNSLFAAVKKAYDEKHTSADETLKNLEVVAGKALDLINEYYDDAYAYAYREAAQAGYISDAAEGIDSVIKALAEIDLSGTEMTDEFKAEVAAEIAEIIETLEKAKELINEADVLDNAAYEALIAMLVEAGEAIEQLLDVLKQAGVDTNNLVIIPALEAAKDKLLNEVLPAARENLWLAVQAGTEYLLEKLGENYGKLVELLTEVVGEYAGEAAEWIYNWLLDNPAKVIAWIHAYGENFVEFVVEHAEAFGTVIAHLIENFGEDVAQFVMNNANEILATMIQWFEDQGDKAWKLIEAYLAKLNGAVEDVLADLKTTAENLKALAEAELEKFYNETKAQIEGQIAKLEAQLKALKADLEAKKAELENAVGAAKEKLEAAIAEIEKKIAEIEATIAALKAQLEEIPAKLEALKAAAEALQAAVEKAIKDGIAEAKDELQAAIAGAIEAINNAIDAVPEAIAAKLTQAAECLKAALCDLVSDVIEQIVAAVKETAPEVADWIYDYLYNNPEKVIAFINEYGDKLAEALKPVAAVLAYIGYTYGEEILEYVIENADEILKTMVELYEKHGENAWDLIAVYLEELGVIGAINDAIGNVQDSLDAVIEMLKKYGPVVNDAAIKLSQDALKNIQSAAEALIKLVENEIKNFINNVKPGIEAQIKKLQKELEALKKELAELYAKLETATGEAKKQIAQAIAELEKKIAEIEAAIAKLQAQLNEIPAKLEALKEAALALNAAIEKAIAEGIDAAATEIQKALNGVVKAIADAVDVVSDKAAAELKKIAQELKGILNDAYAEATHAEYVIDGESYYVAIGDSTAVSESYVEALAAEMLGLSSEYYSEYKSLNLAKAGMSVEDVAAVLQTNVADIAAADLITLGFGINGFTDATADVLYDTIMGKTVKFDWLTYVGEEGLEYVEGALARVHEEIVASGMEGEYMGINLADLITLAVESYAYNYVSYAFAVPELVDAVHTINEDALVILVGMHNPLEGIAIDVDGTGAALLPIGEYVQYLTDAANIYNAAYAMASQDVTFVNAPAVSTVNESSTLNALQFLMLYMGENSGAIMNPNAEGHAYIAEQIMNALTVTVKKPLWKLYGANMLLGNDLSMFFYVEKEYLDDSTAYYAEITKTYADGTEDVTSVIPYEEWESYNDKLIRFNYTGISAKEMTDDVKVVVYNADGTPASYVWDDSIRTYAMRALDTYENDTYARTMMVDMLNYGAAAQEIFGYNTDNMANDLLTGKQARWATPSVELADNRVKGEKYYGTSLSLKSNIILTFYFTDITPDMTAVATFSNHYGEAKTVTIDGADFYHRSENLYGVDVTGLVVADGRQLVEVKVMDANGNVVASATDSVESYVARMSSVDELYEMAMKFVDSAYAYLHRN